MQAITTYLYFNGNCEEAFRFYASTFNGRLEYIGRYKDFSTEVRENFPHCTDDHIMHITLKINDHITLMGADIIDPAEINTLPIKNKFALHIHTDTRVEADHIFHLLAQEGNILVPLDDQFWGSYYGLCIDKFHIQWKVSYSK